MADCDEVVILSYSKPEAPGCEAHRRERWLASSFPSAVRLVLDDARLARLQLDGEFTTLPRNDDRASVHRRFVGMICRRVIGAEVNAVFTSERYGDGFAAELTADFRQRGRGTVVEHVAVDEARRAVPISGSTIRADVHANRHWLLPGVYPAFVRRICVLGGESSGKSTLAAALAESLGTAIVPEYGRELWERRAGRLSFDDMLHIAETQVAAEDEAATRAHALLIGDTSPLTTLFYSRRLFGRADAALKRLADRRYDLTVLCAPDFPFVQDGTRAGRRLRDEQHAWYLSQLASRAVPWMLASGSVGDRVSEVRALLAGLHLVPETIERS